MTKNTPTREETEAAAAVRRAPSLSHEENLGHRLGFCPECDEKFLYGEPGDDVQNLDPCPNCDSRGWEKWGVRMPLGKEIHHSDY